MVRSTVISGMVSGCAGIALGFGAGWLMSPEPQLSSSLQAPTPESIELAKLKQEVAMQKLENELLLKMVKAGLKGDIAGHMETYRQLPGRPRASDRSTPGTDNAADDESSSNAQSTANPIDATAFIARIQQADIALQKQAIREGWAYDAQLSQARRELWQEARETLNETEYLQGMHAAGLPNMLYFGGAKSSEARRLGLEYGDVLTHIDGVRVYNRDDLRLQLENYGTQSTLELTFSRKGTPIRVQVTDLNANVELHGDSVAPEDLYSKARRGAKS